MKASLAFFGLVAALALPTLGSATPMHGMTWNFVNDVTGNNTGAKEGVSKSFTDTQNDAAATITASVDPNVFGLFDLYEKKQGGDENGLGVVPGADNEITFGLPGIKLDFSKVLALNPSAIFLSLNSITGSDVATITYLDGDHDNDPSSFNVSNSTPVSLNLSELKEEGGSILVTAARGNVLIGNVTATPEPANAALLGLGLVAAGFFGRKRLVKQS